MHVLNYLVKSICIVHVYSLRAPKAPDANADMGQHSFSYAVMPHYGKCALYRFLIMVSLIKAGSQCDTSPCVMLHQICNII